MADSHFPPPSLDGQWVRDAYGMSIYTGGCCEKLLANLLFLAVLPLIIVAFLFFFALRILGCCFGKCLTNWIEVLFQEMAFHIATSMPTSYFGLLLMRVKAVYDFTWNPTLSYGGWFDVLGSENFWYYDGFYKGTYEAVKEILMDPDRKRSLSLGSSILSVPGSFCPATPIFFDTGSRYHRSWIQEFTENLVQTPEMRDLLDGGGAGLKALNKAAIDAWLNTPDAHSQTAVATCVVRIILLTLYGVRNPPEALVQACVAYTSGIGSFTAVMPAWVANLACGIFQSRYSRPAREQLTSLLLDSCSTAKQKQEQLKGKAFDWDGMAKNCNVGTELFVQSVVDATLFAGGIGTSTMVAKSALPRLRGAYKPEWSSRVEPQPSKEEYLRLYKRDPKTWLLEAVRLQPPVQSSSKVVSEPQGCSCPFRGKTYTLPRNSFVTAQFYTAFVDKQAWGEDAYEFKPGTRKEEMYMNWNGPWGEDAPRKCPGELLSFTIAKVMVDCWVNRFTSSGDNESSPLLDDTQSCC